MRLTDQPVVAGGPVTVPQAAQQLATTLLQYSGTYTGPSPLSSDAGTRACRSSCRWRRRLRLGLPALPKTKFQPHVTTSLAVRAELNARSCPPSGKPISHFRAKSIKGTATPAPTN
jgi:hypothetical protein